MVHEERL